MAIDVYRTPEEACQAVQIKCPYYIHSVGWTAPWQICSTLDKRHDGAGRIKRFSDDSGGIVWNWRLGLKALWRSNGGKELTPREIAEARRKAAAEEQRAIAYMKKIYAQKANQAAFVYKSCMDIKQQHHGYLTKKRIQGLTYPSLRISNDLSLQSLLGYTVVSQGIAMQGQILVAPIYRIADYAIRTLQFIDADGHKAMMRQGEMKGNAWLPYIPEDGELDYGTVGIAEGVATALSVTALYGHFCMSAMCCANLPIVALNVREKFPDARIVIYSDVGNGEKDAEKAAYACGGSVEKPRFEDHDVKAFRAMMRYQPTDFNDYAILTGRL